MLRLYFIGIIILVSAIILNIISQFLGLKTWYDFLNGISEKMPIKSLINFWDFFWLFFFKLSEGQNAINFKKMTFYI